MLTFFHYTSNKAYQTRRQRGKCPTHPSQQLCIVRLAWWSLYSGADVCHLVNSSRAARVHCSRRQRTLGKRELDLFKAC